MGSKHVYHMHTDNPNGSAYAMARACKVGIKTRRPIICSNIFSAHDTMQSGFPTDESELFCQVIMEDSLWLNSFYSAQRNDRPQSIASAECMSERSLSPLETSRNRTSAPTPLESQKADTMRRSVSCSSLSNVLRSKHDVLFKKGQAKPNCKATASQGTIPIEMLLD